MSAVAIVSPHPSQVCPKPAPCQSSIVRSRGRRPSSIRRRMSCRMTSRTMRTRIALFASSGDACRRHRTVPELPAGDETNLLNVHSVPYASDSTPAPVRVAFQREKHATRNRRTVGRSPVPLHRELALCDDFNASDTAFTFARTARDPLQAAARQNTAFDSPSNEKAQRLWVGHRANFLRGRAALSHAQ